MTIKRALISTVNFTIPDDRIEKALIDADLDGNAIYDKTAEKAIDLCMAGLLLTLMTSADITEDDVSIKLPERKVLQGIVDHINIKWGLIKVARATVKRIM
jgi:hypothetical protein